MKGSEYLEGTGGRLKKIREHLGISREDMARRLGLSWPAYYKNEAGISFPRAAVLKRLEKEYDISMDWLMFGKGTMYYKKEQERVASLEKELESIKKELENEREAAAVKEREYTSKAAGISITPELKALLDYMARVPLLHHELMAHFERFKMNNREFVETTQPNPEN